MIDRMLEMGDLARAAIQMWSKDPSAKIVFDAPKEGKVRVQITADIPQRDGAIIVERKGELNENCSV